MRYLLRVKLLLVGTLMVLCFFPGNLEGQEGYDYFRLKKPPENPPYDSSEMRLGRTTLMSGHLLHNAFHGISQLQSFDRGLNLGLQEWTPVLGALKALPPVINWLNGEIHPRAIWLQHHGNNMGWFLGAHASELLSSSERYLYFTSPDYHLWSASTSLGLGILGYELGKNAGWSQNRISMYKHYSTMFAFMGYDWSRRANDVNRRGRAFAGLFSAFTGYGLGHLRYKLSNSPDLTRGDHVATDAFTIYNTFYSRMLLLAFGHEPSVEDPLSKLPYLVMFGSSIGNQEMVRNARLSRGQSKVLIGVLGGATAIQWVISSQIIDGPLEPAPMVGTYLAGNVAYKLMLDNMIDQNVKRRGGHSDARASFSILPISPATSLPGKEQGIGINEEKEWGLNAISLNMTMEF